MESCSYCGNRYPKTKATRKYCSPRCKTNACLDRRPRRIHAAGVEALLNLLERDFASAEELQDTLRSILKPDAPALPLANGRPVIPALD